MANEEQAKSWSEGVGPAWLANEEALDESSRPFGDAAVEAAEVRPGERIIDIGCGTGTTTVDLATRVGPTGHVLGNDISPLLLGRARERAADAGVENVEFVAADAQTHRFDEAAYDLAYSRFGVMFFEDPVAAFTNIRRALKPGGRLSFTCWQDVKANAWMSVPVMAAMSVLGPPEPPPPDGPGPFRFADADVVRSILDAAGFANIDVRDLTTTMDTPLERASRRLVLPLRMGPVGALFAASDDATQRRAIDAAIDAVGPFTTGGIVRLPAAVWIITARNVA